jgi:hypothetical protein
MSFTTQDEERQSTSDGYPDSNRSKQEKEEVESLSAVDSNTNSEDEGINITLVGPRLSLLTASLTLAVFMVSTPTYWV